MKYLIKLEDGTYLKKLGRYVVYRRNEEEKEECLKSKKELEHYIKILENFSLKYEIIEIA